MNWLLLFIVNLTYVCTLKCYSQGENGVNPKNVDCSSEEWCTVTSKYAGCMAKSSCPTPSLLCNKTTAHPCCCHSYNCNLVTEQSKRDTGDNNFQVLTIVFIVVFGGILVVAVTFVACYFIRSYRKKDKREEKGKNLVENLETSSLSHRVSDDSKRDSSREQISIRFEDKTTYKVPLFIEPDTLKSLLDAAHGGLHLPYGDHPRAKATLVKLIAYSTSDQITMIDMNNDTTTGKEDSSSGSSSRRSSNALFLSRLLRHGPQQFNYNSNELKEILRDATEVWAQESTFIEIPTPCVVYGDIHGQYSDLFRWFNLNGWPHQTRCLFLGDFVDRGSHGIEVVSLIAALKLCFPNSVYVTRGNHEEELLNRNYSFHTEVEQRFPRENVYKYFKGLFGQLPLAALIGGKILGMHGGISPKLTCFDDIRNIRRPIDEFKAGTLECDLVWSDPDMKRGRCGFRPNTEREPKIGIGQLFSEDAVEKKCQELNVDMIIRGHQVPLTGYNLYAGGRLVTLFSAPGYKGVDVNTVNMGACIEIDNKLHITIKQIRVTEEYRMNRINDQTTRGFQRYIEETSEGRSPFPSDIK